MKRGRESGRRSSPSSLREGGRPSRQQAGTASATNALTSGEESSSLSPDLVLLGEFGRAHGLKGEVRLKSFTADPKAIAAYGPLVTESGASVTLAKLRSAGAAPDLFIAQVEGVTTRQAAEALNRVRLYLHRSTLPPPEDEDEFLLADLVGLRVEAASGETLGTVVAVPNYGGGDLIEIEPSQGPSALLPFTKAFVPVVDLKGRRIVVDPPDDLFAPPEPEPDHP